MNSYRLVDSDNHIDDVRVAIRPHPVIGVDAERASGFRYGQDAYLIQLIAENVAFLVDPVNLSDESISALAEEINQKEWVLHSATQDLPCLNALGFYPKSIFDTEVAAKLAGFERFGLAAIVEQILGIELKKEHSAADWSLRPLSPEMLEYAAQDVYYLLSIRDTLNATLAEMGRTEYAQQEFEHLLDFKPKPVGPNPWRRCTGIHALKKPLHLARLREMWLVRDEYARRMDIAPGRVASDRSLSYAAGEEYKSISDMRKDKQFHGRLLPRLYGELFEAYSKAPQTQMPPLREENGDVIPHHKNWHKLKPEVDASYKKVRAKISELGEETGIPIESLMSPQLIRDVLWNEIPKEDLEPYLLQRGARSWQLGFILPILRDLS